MYEIVIPLEISQTIKKLLASVMKLMVLPEPSRSSLNVGVTQDEQYNYWCFACPETML